MIEFITVEEYEDLNGSSYHIYVDKLNEILNRVYDKAVEDTLRSIPQVVGSLSKHAVKLNELSKDFYKTNPDLTDHKELVGKTISKIESENPGLAYEEVLKKVLPEVRNSVSKLKLFDNSPVTKNPGQPSLNGVL